MNLDYTPAEQAAMRFAHTAILAHASPSPELRAVAAQAALEAIWLIDDPRTHPLVVRILEGLEFQTYVDDLLLAATKEDAHLSDLIASVDAAFDEGARMV